MRRTVFASIAALAASCHLVSGIDDLDYVLGGAGGGPAPGENGAPCAGADECNSTHCVDGVCCESACDAPCSSCALDGRAGTCSLHATGTNPDGECTSGTCDASGTCVGANLVFGNTLGNIDIHDIAVRNDDGTFFVAGAFNDTVDVGDGDRITSQGQDIIVAAYSSQGQFLWKKHLGSPENDGAYGVAVDAQGDVWVTGYVGGTVNFGGGDLTPNLGAPVIFLARFDAGSAHELSVLFNSTEPAMGLDIEVAGDRVFVFGTHGGNLPLLDQSDPFPGLFLARFDPEGTKQWALSFSGDNAGANLDGPQRLAVSPSGDCAIVGGFQGTLKFANDLRTSNPMVTDGYLARIDENANYRWSKSFAMQIPSLAAPHTDVALDDGGNIFVTGQFFQTIDLESGELASAGGSDIFVAAFAPEGNALWSKRFGDGAVQEGRAIVVDEEGTLVITGKAQGAFDFGGGELSHVGEDLFLLRLAADGTHLFSAKYGEAGDQMGEALAVQHRAPIVGGYCETAIDFGAGPKPCTPGAFLAGFGP